ncbi:MAG: DUF2334 domain-containing protein [Cypionkella sp.]
MVTTLPDRVYLPEIHDLHPGMAARIDPLLALLPHDARRVVAWSVVPDWQGRAPLTAHPGFCERLRGLEGDIVLHGLTHSLGPDWFNWVVYGHDNRSEFHCVCQSPRPRAGWIWAAPCRLPPPGGCRCGFVRPGAGSSRLRSQGCCERVVLPDGCWGAGWNGRRVPPCRFPR